jgi:hypothetical protein
MPPDVPALARAIHVLVITFWIGGIFFVTFILHPAIIAYAPPGERLKLFKAMHHPFGTLMRWSIVLVGVTGLYLIYAMDLWSRFLDPHSWYLHAMVLVWGFEAFMRFLFGPIYMHRRNDRWAGSSDKSEAAFAGMVERQRFIGLISMPTIVVAVMGAHGYLPF